MSKDFRDRVKLAWIRCMDAVGTSASNMASNAKQKVAETNLESRRREILRDFSLRAYALWQKGERLPGELEALLQELTEVDEKLSVLRAQRYNAQVAAEAAKNAEEAAANAATEDSAQTETEPEPADAAIEEAPCEAAKEAPCEAAEPPCEAAPAEEPAAEADEPKQDE